MIWGLLFKDFFTRLPEDFATSTAWAMIEVNPFERAFTASSLCDTIFFIHSRDVSVLVIMIPQAALQFVRR
jgi:hypothetical protein